LGVAEEGHEFVPLADGVGDGLPDGGAGQSPDRLPVQPLPEFGQVIFEDVPAVTDEGLLA